MWQAATGRGLKSPDWTTSTRPAHCRLDETAYTILLRDRITGSALDTRPDHALVSTSPGTAIVTWTGRKHARQVASEETRQIAYPDADDDETKHGRGAALFTRRGDYLATGWLGSYQQIQ